MIKEIGPKATTVAYVHSGKSQKEFNTKTGKVVNNCSQSTVPCYSFLLDWNVHQYLKSMEIDADCKDKNTHEQLTL